jgi:hypothetical protein
LAALELLTARLHLRGLGDLNSHGDPFL